MKNEHEIKTVLEAIKIFDYQGDFADGIVAALTWVLKGVEK